jgi:hypothetical protein
MSDDEDNKKNKKGELINIQKLDPTHFEKEQMPYTLICNNVINKCKNPVAGFIWIYLQSKPPTWTPNKWEIMKRFDISEATYKRHMRYLSSCGLIEYHRMRLDDGTIGNFRLVVLNGSNFNPEGDTFKGTVFDLTNIHGIKNDTVVDPAPVMDCDHGIIFDTVASIHSIKKPPSGEMTPHINTRSTSSVKKEKDIPPISPKGGKGGFGLLEMLKDNPHNIPDRVLADWMEVRKAKRAKMTETTWQHVNKNLSRLKTKGLEPLFCFTTAVARSWAGLEIRFFDEYLPKQNKYPTPDERAAEYERIAQREREAEERKKAEIAASRGGLNAVIQNAIKHVNLKDVHAQHEAERLKLGLSKIEYHEQIILGKNKRTMPEDSV